MSIPIPRLRVTAAGLVLMALFLGLGGTTTVAQNQYTSSSPIRQGLQAYQENRFNDAISHLRHVVDTGTDRPRVYAVLTLSLLQTEQMDEAHATVEEATDRFGAHPLLRLARAEVLLTSGAERDALSLYRDLESEQSNQSSGSTKSLLQSELLNRRISQIHQKLGGQAYADGDTARAQRHFEAARGRGSDSPQLYANLGVLHLDQNRPQKALSLAEAGLERANPDDAVVDPLLRVKASALEALEAPDRLANVYTRLATRNPNDVQIQIRYAQALITTDDRRKGLKQFRSLLKQFPNDRRAYEALIDVLDQFGNTNGALRILRRLQEQFPKDPAVLRRIAERLEDLHRLSDARAVYDSVLVQTGDTLDIARAKARTYEAEDQFLKAAAEYRLAIRQPTAEEGSYRDLGRVLEQAGRFETALDVYDRWKRSGSNPAADLHRGRMYEQLQEPDRATASYEAAVQQGIEHPLPFARLAHLYGEQGRSAQAFEHATEALRTGIGGKVRLHSAPDTSAAAEKRVLRAQTRRSRRTADRWRQSVTAAFDYLVDNYPHPKVQSVLTDLLSDHPNNGQLHLLVGRYHQSHGRFSTARKHLRQAARQIPENPSVHVERGRVAVAQGDTTAAVRSLKRAFALDPTRRSASSLLIDLYQNQGRLGELITEWHRRYETNPTDELREPLIEALHKAGRYDEARTVTQSDSTTQ